MQVGERFGRYLLLEQLRSSGMAALWIARNWDDDERVALKVVRQLYAEDPIFCRMLEEEARVARRVVHPNVVPILDVGVVDETPYLALRYVDGVTLALVLDRGQRAGSTLSLAQAVEIARQTLLGLHAAHETIDEDGQPLELVHRDVSPSNIMISRTGETLLIDFGIARARGRSIKTSAGTIKGKFGYMPPEALTQRNVDHRADLYSLAIVLWECLTGRRYFEADFEVDLLMMARHPRPVAPSGVRPEIPGPLDEVVLKALSPRPADRYPTGAEFAKALESALPACLEVTRGELAELTRTP